VQVLALDGSVPTNLNQSFEETEGQSMAERYCPCVSQSQVDLFYNQFQWGKLQVSDITPKVSSSLFLLNKNYMRYDMRKITINVSTHLPRQTRVPLFGENDLTNHRHLYVGSPLYTAWAQHILPNLSSSRPYSKVRKAAAKNPKFRCQQIAES
jgi:hypothetical protein